MPEIAWFVVFLRALEFLESLQSLWSLGASEEGPKGLQRLQRLSALYEAFPFYFLLFTLHPPCLHLPEIRVFQHEIFLARTAELYQRVRFVATAAER